MSTAVDSRRRPNLWSYISFSSTPRRRSISLPTRTIHDPFEKADRHAHKSTRSQDWKPVAMNQGTRSRFFKYGGAVAFIILLFLWLSPGGSPSVGDLVGGSSSTQSGDGQTKCSKPYSSDKPLIQYALMIDAGSTGSRIHVYRFNNCGSTPELEYEGFMMTEKKPGGSGLSSYGKDALGAAKSLDPLMAKALEDVPEEYRGCTPVAVKATAGLRMLGENDSKAILKAVRERLETQFPFPVVSEEKEGVVIMDGKDEGVYAWITTNYLLGKIGGPDKSPTAAVFDLGGGSTQIVFEPTFKSSNKGMPETLAEGDHKYKLDFGGRKFELYQHSHLGYGLMAARDAILREVVEKKRAANPDGSWVLQPIENPCIPPLVTTKPIKVKLLDTTEHTVSFVGPLIAAPAQCRAIAERILQKDAECKLAPCSFGGVHQPSLGKTFAREDVYIFSYFYDRLHALGMPESFNLREMQDLTAQVCSGEAAWKTFETVEGAVAELKEHPLRCLDLNFMLALLHTGYEMPIDREVRIAKKIKDKELGWCLGASLPLLSKQSGWQCKIKQVA